MMSSGPSNPSAAAVLSPQYCVSHPVEFTITRKMMTMHAGTFSVTDADGNIAFNVQGKSLSLHDRRVLRDTAGNPIVTFQQKLMTAYRRWEAFRGESRDPKDMIFSVRKSTVMMMRTKLSVFLAGNKDEEKGDYRIEGNWWESSCTIYAGQTDNIVAQMHRKHSVTSVLFGKDTFCVTVYPNVDHAFIVALVVILEEINEDRHAS